MQTAGALTSAGRLVTIRSARTYVRVQTQIGEQPARDVVSLDLAAVDMGRYISDLASGFRRRAAAPEDDHSFTFEPDAD